MDTHLSTLDAHPDKPRVYSSPLILERRRRLLKETRLMVAESGYENFSIRTLCRRAEVAQRTLYNSFQNKDRLIALALREAIEDIHKNEKYKTDRNSLAGVLDRAVTAHRRNFRVPNYVKAVVSIYFGQSTPRDVWESLRDMSLNRTREWLSFMKEKGQLETWVNEAQFADVMANAQYCVINDWCQERISTDDYLARVAEAMLLLIAGVTRGAVREEAQVYLAEIRATGRPPTFSKPSRNNAGRSQATDDR